MSDFDHEEEQGLRSPDVTTKYQAAAEIVNKALKLVVDSCVDGSLIIDLCAVGDNYIRDSLNGIFKGKEKSIAFPTCITVNNMCGALSPVPWDAEAAKMSIKKGDLVKIDLGAQIDGYPVIGGHTFVLGAESVTGRTAETIKAALTVCEAVQRLVKPGKTNTEVTAAINKICKEFNCNPVANIYSHEMKRHILDGRRTIVSQSSAEDRVEPFTFDEYEVYGMDIAISSGDGKVKALDIKPTVFKRDLAQNFQLRTNLSRAFIGEVNKNFPTMAFSLRAISSENIARVGVTESIRHNLLDAFPVTTERSGEVIVQFKFTLLVLPSGTKKITGLPFTQTLECATNVQDAEIVELLAQSTSNKKSKKKAAPAAQ